MRAMWIAILWMTGLWVALAFGSAPPPSADALPSIHIVRVNDPTGMQGYDVKCSEAKEEGAEPECSMTEVKASKTVQRSTISLERARKIASAFLSSMPKERIYRVSKARESNPPVADVLLTWKVELGEKGSDGVLKREIPEAERDPSLQRAVLLMESELGTDQD